MRHRHRSIATVLVLALTLVSQVASMGARSDILVIDRPFAQLYPRTDGVTVVWQDTGDAVGAQWSIVGSDTVHGWVFPVAIGGTTKGSPDIDGDFIVWADRGTTFLSGWEENWDIWGFNLISGETFVIADSPLQENSPAISGDWVIWFADDDPFFISKVLMARNIRTMEPAITLAENIGFRNISPAIDGDRAVWVHNPDQGIRNNELWTTRIGIDREPILVRSGLSIDDQSVDVSGDIITYIESGAVIAHDLADGSIRTLAESEWSDDGYYITHYQHPTTDGRFVCWTDNRDWIWGNGNWIECYDLANDSRFVAYDDGYNWWPHVENGTLVWTHWDTIVDDVPSEQDIYIARIPSLLPSARVAPGDVTDPDAAYLPETGHTLGGIFRGYWETHGGLPVFGYPLTEEFEEANADSGGWHTVQFTERQRFEHHPANAGTVYEVLLGRLGAETLALQGRDWQSFPQADPSAPYFVPETGHAIAPEFWGYWSSHGLDLGDPGVSYRESVALFGYPLSKPMMETNGDGHIVLTQWFERAVFELHPQNPEPHRVLLRRLGAETLVDRGWNQP